MKCRRCKTDIADNSAYCHICGVKQALPERKPKSRGNGTGTVYQRSPGNWIAIITLGYDKDENGKMHRLTRSKSGFKTKKEALAYLQILTNPLSVIDNKIKFKELYEKWLKEHSESVGRDTINCYKSAYKYYNNLYFVEFNQIKTDHLQACVDACPKERATKKNMKTLATLLYRFAMKNDIAIKNYGEYIRLPKTNTKEREVFNKEEIEKIKQSIGKIPNAEDVFILIHTGWRINEYLDLRKTDYDETTQSVVGGSKTKAGKSRVVTLSPKIQALIKNKASVCNEYLTEHNKKRMSDKMFREKYYAALKAIGVNRLTPHACRHTFATLMKDVDAPATDKQKLIGHSKFEMTAQYTHTDIESLRKITDTI